MNNKKRGISPVIATILLIVVAIILFLIIFLWLKGFQKEALLKNNSPIENSCRSLNYAASYSNGNLEIRNEGSVTIFRFDIYKIAGGNTNKIGNVTDVGPISNARFSSNQLIGCEKIKIAPYLLGITSKGERKESACDGEIKTITC